jgi:hypothetical protein
MSMSLKRRILYFIMIIFLAASLGCQKKYGFRRAEAPLPIPRPGQQYQQIDYRQSARIVLDVCVPSQTSAKPKKELSLHDHFFCTLSMKAMEEYWDKHSNRDVLKKLIKDRKKLESTEPK